ncbi:hypothetical protein FO519_004953 [Halicephalobus sp. NKZ332]|nr:hypothetical protein FO519_004953 [Halicephalobus sp. NKZ332]
MSDYGSYKQVNQEDSKENANPKESETSVQIYALTLNPSELKPAGYVEEVLPPTQHIKLFLPFFIEEIRAKHIRRHRTFFGLTGVGMFEEALRIKDKDKKIQALFKLLAYALDNVNVACAFAEWFLDHSNVKDDIKQLFWLRSMDKEAFAVYEHHILGMGNEKGHEDNIDRIAGFLYLDEVIHYLLHLAGDSQYYQIGVEIELIWSEKTQLARWKARNLLLLRLMHTGSSKKSAKFWFNEFLVALDRHPKTRPIAAYLDPDYKITNEKYLIYLKTLRVPVKFEFDLVDESEIPKEPRPQSDFEMRRKNLEYVIGDNYILRNYQEELSSKAKKGINTIICAPTGSGKTFVALEIIVNHLRLKRQYHQTSRVVLFVPTIPLVEQQHRRIQNRVGSEFSVTKMSGAEKTSMTCRRISTADGANPSMMDKENTQASFVLAGDICVMTPQIFVNMLLTPLKKQKIYIADFTLMIFDECHHCTSNHPYNVIMENIQKSDIKPQVVGLTASVGTGKARGIRSFDCEAIMEHIFGLCARMNATTVTSIRDPENLKELRSIVPVPMDEFIKMSPKVPDKFANTLALFMDNVQKDLYNILETFANGELKKHTDPKSRLFLEEKSTSMNGECKYLIERLDSSQKQNRNLCLNLISVLEKCYCVLKMNELFPTGLALEFLKEQFSDFEEIYIFRNTSLSSVRLEKLKSVVDDLYETLDKLEKNTLETEDKPILTKLFEIIHEQYTKEPTSRILIFVDLRKAASQLCDYLAKSETVTSTFGKNRVAYITSSNQTFAKFGQSRDEQNMVLKKFEEGEINVLIATSVAEEGLDIASCNLVIKYNSIGSEKSLIQRKGRARAEFSRSILLTFEQYIEQTEFLNIQRAYYMNLCVERLQNMREIEVSEKINKIKFKMLKEKEIKEARKKNQSHDVYKIICMTCHKYICSTTDVRLLQPSYIIVCRRDCWTDTTIRRKRGRNMVGSLHEYEDIFKIATLCELDNLEELKKTYARPIIPNSTNDLHYSKGLHLANPWLT